MILSNKKSGKGVFECIGFFVEQRAITDNRCQFSKKEEKTP